MCISVHQLCYVHADKEPLFQNIDLTVNKGQRQALVGNNGSGKSTLLRILAGNLKPSSGEVVCASQPYYVPQHFGQFDHLTVAEALRVDGPIKALHAILAGDASVENFTRLNDDWSVEERCLSALAFWDLGHLQLSQPMRSLSGGEKTKVFLSGISVHTPEIILMDEPTNHLDASSRDKLYEMVRTGRSTLLVVSHDRTLLNLLPCICELEKNGVTLYGGNYDFYREQKELALIALQNQLDEKEKELRLARKMARETMERKNKANAHSDKTSFKKGISRMAVNTLKDKAEKSTVRLNDVHEEKIASLQSSVAELQNTIPDMRALQTNFNSSALHTGKILITAEQVNFGYTSSSLWPSPLDLRIRSGDRVHITGNNGSGKTTLVRLLLGELEPMVGTVTRADFSYLYIDQECSVIDPALTVFGQTERFNTEHKAEHELKSILNRYLFPYGTWDKPGACLSGGEKIRLLFCCLMIGNNTPDLFILDEPTNNLDIRSVEIITAAIKSYRGTVLLISHDLYFVKEIQINRSIKLFNSGPVIKT
ncbi:ABC-F family ATP-binding cassette domain-containing protein [uncultured Parabacteroides sp.]|uniref:ABC-F family ATP-binding cassette domain-containing protein n=1 Tax=uncultured Parabacteroides sp. TaxID=512312 RepID=UPI0025E9ACF6|nr:ABC-F family ATP-binding cassette domain-containing protein [uncultured Parabacteroides sp.]